MTRPTPSIGTYLPSRVVFLGPQADGGRPGTSRRSGVGPDPNPPSQYSHIRRARVHGWQVRDDRRLPCEVTKRHVGADEGARQSYVQLEMRLHKLEEGAVHESDGDSLSEQVVPERC